MYIWQQRAVNPRFNRCRCCYASISERNAFSSQRNQLQYLCTKVTQKALQHNFVLIVIYYIILEHTHRLTSWMYYIPRFFTQSPSTSTAFGQRATRSFLCQFDFCSRSHFVTFSLTSSSIPKLFPRMASVRAPKR